MTSSRFDLGSTLKTLNLFFLRFNERSGFQNLASIMTFNMSSICSGSTRCPFSIQAILISLIFLLSSIMTFNMSSICEVVPSLNFCFFNLSFWAFTLGGLSKFTIGTCGISSSSKLIDSRLEGEDRSDLPLFFG